MSGLGKLPKADKIAERFLRNTYREMCAAELEYIEWDSPSKKVPENTIKGSSQMEGYTISVEVRIEKI